MKIKTITLLAGVLAMSAMGAAKADDAYKGFQPGDILVRGRALAVLPTVTSTVSGIGGQVDASASVEPEIDASYFFTPNWAVEGIAAITRHHITDKGSSLGNVDLGHTTLLPPSIMGQYHFMPAETFSPYVGAGVNYTMFFDSTLPSGGAAHSINYENSFGEVLQAGADVHIQGNWYANIDVKHIFLTTRAKINGGGIVASVNLDPTIVGMGIGYKF